ncbi:MAG: pilus assembly protein [Sphingorhabdus sp.]
MMARTGFKRLLRQLGASQSGVAIIEFAYSMPVLMVVLCVGTELTNYSTTVMRVNQIALQTADNAARVGAGSPLALKTITETDINDLITGAQLQSGNMDILGTHTSIGAFGDTGKNGRIIISSLEPVATNKYKINWARCGGQMTTHASTYGVEGDTNLDGMGPAGRQVIATDASGTIFVEVAYFYQPLFFNEYSITKNYKITAIASMPVREARNTTLNNAAGATQATC